MWENRIDREAKAFARMILSIWLISVFENISGQFYLFVHFVEYLSIFISFRITFLLNCLYNIAVIGLKIVWTMVDFLESAQYFAWKHFYALKLPFIKSMDIVRILNIQISVICIYCLSVNA